MVCHLVVSMKRAGKPKLIKGSRLPGKLLKTFGDGYEGVAEAAT